MKLQTISFIVLLVASLFAGIFTLNSVRAQPTKYGARIDNIRFRVIKSHDAQTLAMLRRDIDILTGLTDRNTINYLSWAGRKIPATPGDHFCYVAFNMRPYMSSGKANPFGPQSGGEPGRSLRHAIAHLVDKTGSPDTATVIDAPMSAAIGTFGASVDPHPFDMTMAEDILLAAGWTWNGSDWLVPLHSLPSSEYPLDPGDPVPIIDFISPTITVAPTSYAIAEAICGNMRTLGFDVSHTACDFITLINKIDANDFDMYFLCWQDMGRFGDHLYDFFHSSNDFPSGYNYPGVRNGTLDNVLLELHATLVKTYMEAKVVEALELLMGTSNLAGTEYTNGIIPYIPIYSRTYYDAWDEYLPGAVNEKMKGSWNSWSVSNMEWITGYERYSDLPIFAPGTKTMAIFCLSEDYQYPANPAWASSAVTWDQIEYIYEELKGTNPYNLKEKKGWLDLSRDPSPDTTPGYNVSLWTVTDGPRAGEQGMKVDFYLNTSVTRKWHDGHDWDAWDVAFAWEYLTANKIPRAWSNFKYLHHTEVNHPNNDTVTAYMTTPSIVLAYSLSEWSSMFPEHIWGCTHGRGGRAEAGCGTEDRETAWNAQLSWINSGDVAGTAGTKPGTDADAGVESGLCLCAVGTQDPSPGFKLSCEHDCGCVMDDRTTLTQNEILMYDPASYAWATPAYPWLTELIGTGPYVYYDINVANGIGNLVVFDESTHASVQPGVHYSRTVDEIHTMMVEYFWECGDVNKDGFINIMDLAIQGAWFMEQVPPAPADADMNGDGIIDIRDMSYPGKNYGDEREVDP